MKLTPWFPAHVKPARVGLYQRNWGFSPATKIPDFWDGKSWYVVFIDGSQGKYPVPREQYLPWRGLAKKP